MNLVTPREISSAAMARETTPRVSTMRGAGVQIPLEVRTKADGSTHLVNSETGAFVGICASPAIGERTKAFFS